jgi:hypothetical protein
MKTKSTLIKIAIPVVLIGVIAKEATTKSSGITGRTGSQGETTCSSCHSGGTTGTTISLSSSDMINWNYVPGTTYNLSLTISKTGQPLFGFDLECLNSSNTSAGTLIANGTNNQVLTSTNGRVNLTHKKNGGLANNSKTFNFQWTAPATNVGNLTFYFAGAACNNNGSDDSGDYTKSGTQIITPANTTSIPNLNYAKNSFTILNNPITNQLLKVKYTNNDPTGFNLLITDINGKNVFQENFLGNISEGIAEINLNENQISKGIYFVTLKNSQDVKTQKIVVE